MKMVVLPFFHVLRRLWAFVALFFLLHSSLSYASISSTSFVYANGNPVIFINKSNDVHYYQVDFLYSIRAVYDSEAEIKELKYYYPFGEEVAFMSSTDNSLAYKSNQFDEISNTYLVSNNRYSPDIGRYLVPKGDGSVFLPQTFNIYNYALNNPFRAITPNEVSPDLTIPEAPGQVVGKAYPSVRFLSESLSKSRKGALLKNSFIPIIRLSLPNRGGSPPPRPEVPIDPEVEDLPEDVPIYEPPPPRPEVPIDPEVEDLPEDEPIFSIPSGPSVSAALLYSINPLTGKPYITMEQAVKMFGKNGDAIIIGDFGKGYVGKMGGVSYVNPGTLPGRYYYVISKYYTGWVYITQAQREAGAKILTKFNLGQSATTTRHLFKQYMANKMKNK